MSGYRIMLVYRAALLCVGCIVCSACGKTPNEILFVVPDGYRGPIAIVSDTRIRSSSIEKVGARSFSLPVPASALTCITDEQVFHPFRASAQYANGSPIYRYGPGSQQSEAISLASIGAWSMDEEGLTVWWFGVGDQRELLDLERSFFADEIQSMLPTGITLSKRDSLQSLISYCDQG